MTAATATVTILRGLPVKAYILHGEVDRMTWLNGKPLSQCIYDKLPDGWQDDVVKQVLDQFEAWELEDNAL